MKSNTRQVRKIDKATEQKAGKRKRFHPQPQSSQYLKNVIYQSSSSLSSSSRSYSPIHPQERRQTVQLAPRVPSPPRVSDPDTSSQDELDDDNEIDYGITAQKSKRFNQSSIFQLHASNNQDTPQELNQTIDQPKESQSLISKFHTTKTPKLREEKKPKEPKRSQEDRTAQPQLKGFTFVELPNKEGQSQRRYPYRISREVPVLKYWQGEKMDLKRNGYWRKSK